MNPHYQNVRKRLRALDEEIENNTKALSNLYSERDRLKNGIEKYNLQSQEIAVSDHALVRYLERVHNIDVAALKRKILTPERQKMIVMGAQRIKGADYTLVINDGRVGTVL